MFLPIYFYAWNGCPASPGAISHESIFHREPLEVCPYPAGYGWVTPSINGFDMGFTIYKWRYNGDILIQRMESMGYARLVGNDCIQHGELANELLKGGLNGNSLH
jgi:hypothetical protein